MAGADRESSTREGYDRVAAEYTRRIADELDHKPFDCALLDAFARRVAGFGPVVDLGCGPGHVAAYLHRRGVDISGLDLSDRMVAEASLRYPDILFRQGSMVDLSERAVLGGIVAFYSIIHIDRDLQRPMFRSWRDALVPGGLILLSFHVGTDDRHLDVFLGVPVDLDFLYHTPEEVESRLGDAGLTVIERHERDPYPGVEADTRRCYLLAHRPDGSDPASSQVDND